MEPMQSRTTHEKISLFRRLFTGLPDVYGTYDPRTGRAHQVKEPVTDEVILAHLRGRQPYGVYLLNQDRTGAIVADFDSQDPLPPMEFVSAAAHYDLAAYMERSKSKGYHVWVFFDGQGVLAVKARLVVRRILMEIEKPITEVFPKHDALGNGVNFGNYIYAPLFGSLVPHGRTVFVDPSNPSRPYEDQWALLDRIELVTEALLDDIIEINALDQSDGQTPRGTSRVGAVGSKLYGLPPCTQKMLAEGVTENQRVACFRLAVQLKRTGLPFDSAAAVLKDWATRNRPNDGKRVITDSEIVSQAACAYDKESRACGCEDPAVMPYCDRGCPVDGKNRSVLK